MSVLKTGLTAALVSAIGITCSVAYADSINGDGFQHSSVVRYGDLDLNRQQDVGKLYLRITWSADQVCGPRTLTGINYKLADYNRCYNDTVAQTVASVGHPALTSYFRQHSSEPVLSQVSMSR
jgi:UrcA family protein